MQDYFSPALLDLQPAAAEKLREVFKQCLPKSTCLDRPIDRISKAEDFPQTYMTLLLLRELFPDVEFRNEEGGLITEWTLRFALANWKLNTLLHIEKSNA